MMLGKVRGFLLGAGSGLLIDLIPYALESALPIALCRESCGDSLRAISILIFGFVPLCCGLVIAWAATQHRCWRVTTFALTGSVFVMTVLTFALYLRQQ